MNASSSNNTSMFVTLMACIMVIAVAMITAIFIAGQRPSVVVVDGRDARPAEPAAPPAAEPAPDLAEPDEPDPAEAPEPEEDAVDVRRIDVTPSVDNPHDAAWDDVPAMDIAMEPQQMAPPRLDAITISHVTVQAVHDGSRMAWRLSWDAPDPRDQVRSGEAGDAVAIQIPLVDNAPYTMGAEGMPVHILHWRAMWQRDVDEGFQGVHALFPNTWVDLYWFTEGDPPYTLPDSFEDERSHEWLIAYSAGNPMADFNRDRPVEELAAEGFGTTTYVPDTPSHARGVWADGRWSVVIDRPLNGDDPLAERLTGDGEHAIALAVWDGAAGNIGGRKHYCTWVPMRIEP